MKVFIKSKKYHQWTKLVFDKNDDNDFKFRKATYYMNQGYYVKIEQ